MTMQSYTEDFAAHHRYGEQGLAWQKQVAGKFLTDLFKDPRPSLKELMQAYVDSDEAGAFHTMLEAQRTAREWVEKTLDSGTSDARIWELRDVLNEFRDVGGSLAPWAFREAPAYEPLPTPPSDEDLQPYLEAALSQEQSISKKMELEAQIAFEGIFERAQNHKELLNRIETDQRLRNLSPSMLAIQCTLFLLSLGKEKLDKRYLDVWRALTERAKKDVSSDELVREREWGMERISDPDATKRLKRSQILFLLDAPNETYLGSVLFEEDVKDFLKKRSTRTNKRQLSEVLDEIEAQLRSKVIENDTNLALLATLQRQRDAIDYIREQALIAFARPSQPGAEQPS